MFYLSNALKIKVLPNKIDNVFQNTPVALPTENTEVPLTTNGSDLICFQSSKHMLCVVYK